jgi:hypothetical protein
MYDSVVANVDGRVRSVIDHISGLHLGITHFSSFFGLRVGSTAQFNAKCLEDLLYKSGTIATVGQRRSTPNIRSPDKLNRVIRHSLPKGSRGSQCAVG